MVQQANNMTFLKLEKDCNLASEKIKSVSASFSDPADAQEFEEIRAECLRLIGELVDMAYCGGETDEDEE